MNSVSKLVRELSRIRHGFGWKFTIRYIYYIFLELPKVLSARSLAPVDQRVEDKVYVTHKNLSYHLPAEELPLIREVLLKNCYGFDSAKTYPVVVDLGANCGIFSVMAARSAHKVISIEFNEKEFSKQFSKVMKMNGIKNTSFVPKYIASFVDENHISMNEITQIFHLQKIDFLKIDIEGAEDDLFSKNLDWLEITERIAMEIHPCFHVDTRKIISVLRSFGFSISLYDLDMRSIPDFSKVIMGYVWANR